MKNTLILTVLALIATGGVAHAQLYNGTRVGYNTTIVAGGQNLLLFGDSEFVTIGEAGSDDHMELRARQFSFIPSIGTGNVGIGTRTPQAKLDVNGAIHSSGSLTLDAALSSVNFGSREGQHLNLWNTLYGIGVQDWTLYFRCDGSSSLGGFAWHAGGSHADGRQLPGATGKLLMSLDGNGLVVNNQISATTLLLTSDRNAKSNFMSVDKREVLKTLASLPLSTWHYTNAPSIRHLGPMAQDFKAAFPELGQDDKHIATVDADGVALASIQALYEIVQEKDSSIAILERQVAELKTELAGVKTGLADRLAALEKTMSKDVLQASFRPEAAR